MTLRGLCQVRAVGRGGWYCTREKGHEGEHIAAVGVYEPGAKVECRWNDSDPLSAAASPAAAPPSVAEIEDAVLRAIANWTMATPASYAQRTPLERLLYRVWINVKCLIEDRGLAPVSAPSSLVDQACAGITTAIRTAVHAEATEDGDHFSHQLAVPDAASPTGGRPTPAPNEEPDAEQSPEWGIVNCHMLARRELRRLTQYTERDSTLPKTIERWQHIIRICERAGATSKGVLRKSLPTEITDGSEPRAQPEAGSAVFPRVERRTPDRPRDETSARSSSSSVTSDSLRALAAELRALIDRIGEHSRPLAIADDLDPLADRLDALAASTKQDRP